MATDYIATTVTDPELEVHEKNGNRDYDATTEGGGLGILGKRIGGNLPSIGKIPAYQTATNIAGVAYDNYHTALRLSYSYIGITRQLAMFGGKATTDGARGVTQASVLVDGKGTNYSAQRDPLNRVDITQPSVIKLGEYYAPTALSYTITADKNAPTSQLVDGPEIIELVNRQPKTIEINIELIRDGAAIFPSDPYSHMQFVEAEGVNETSEGTYIADRIGLANIRAALDDIWYYNEVFLLENDEMRTLHNIEWVFLKRYEFKPRRGSQIIDLSMSLREVNMEENAVVFGQTTIDPDEG